MQKNLHFIWLLLATLSVGFGSFSGLMAHCDRLDGPVAINALEALRTENFQLIQIWVGPEQEAELREAFDRALAVRGLGEEAEDLAERYLVETAVRLHRTAEGMPFTGVRPSGLPLPIDLERAEAALESEDIGAVVKLLQEETATRVEELFRQALERREVKDRSVQAGRRWADAYVRYIVFVHSLYQTIQEGPAHGIDD